jgi:hypothetical protein
MVIALLIIALICVVIALELRLRQKRYDYIARKEIDQIRAFRSKQK